MIPSALLYEAAVQLIGCRSKIAPPAEFQLDPTVNVSPFKQNFVPFGNTFALQPFTAT